MSTYALVTDRLWDGASAQGLTDVAVVVDGGYIAAIVPTSELPSDIERHDFTGATVLPGLIDAHVHYSASMGPAFLAAGVTTARDVGNDLDWILAQRALHAEDAGLGPRLLCCGYLLDGPQPIWPLLGRPHATAEELRARIRYEVAHGVDAIKLYAGLDIELLSAGIDEAHLQGKYVLAHLVNASAEDAAIAGVNEIEHLAGCRAAWEGASDAELDAMIDILLVHNVVMVPTLVVWDRLGRVLDLSFQFDTRRQWVHPCHLDIWREWARTQKNGREEYQVVVPRLKRCLARMHARGLTIAVGTDTPFPHLFPGFSVHDELAMFVDAGISPVDALRCATSVGARVLGLADTVGRIAPGMRADLVIVAGDPLAQIEDISQVRCTIRDGQRFDPGDLLQRHRACSDRAPGDPITRDLQRRVGIDLTGLSSHQA